ncbi:hypothetical protein Q8F55_005962 [Vanrija albida]|uniref:Carbonic anhydrase n=1 Tax=Vanrija albida TaxID=181172 RepID=A0ABR3Q318_9TREE
MSYSDGFEQRNAAFAATAFPGPQPLPPAKGVAVVACMDARLDPRKALGIEIGDAHVIANAGGRAADALRSLIISQQLLGTREIHIVHHTDCGMVTFTNEVLRAKLVDELHTHAGDGIDFLAFPELEASVRDDVAFLRGHELILKESKIVGWVYQVEDGKVRKVVEA